MDTFKGANDGTIYLISFVIALVIGIIGYIMGILIYKTLTLRDEYDELRRK